MKTAPAVVAIIILLPLLSSFSYAFPIEKPSNSGSGTVTLTIQNGFNDKGLLSRIGYTVIFDNTLGTKEVNFTSSVVYHYIKRDVYDNTSVIVQPMAGYEFNILSVPFPMYPFKVTITVTADTSTHLSLTRTGIMILNCYVVFINGNKSITGTS